MIVCSWLFPNGHFSIQRLRELSERVGKHRLVVDLSCRKRRLVDCPSGDNNHSGDVANNNANNVGWIVAMDKWRQLTDMHLSQGT